MSDLVTGVLVGRVSAPDKPERVAIYLLGESTCVAMDEECVRTLADQLLLVANQIWPIEGEEK